LFSGYPPYLHTAGGHLGRLVVEAEAVPPGCQRVVADEVLNGGVLDLGGVKVHAAVGVLQGPVATRVALWSFKDVGG